MKKWLLKHIKKQKKEELNQEHLDEGSMQKKEIMRVNSTFFLKITDELRLNNLELDEGSIMVLSSMLFMLNTNYYYRITEALPSLTKEKLIDKVLEQIVLYLRTTAKKVLRQEDIFSLIKNCYFIDPSVKQKILTEISPSITNIENNRVDYVITRNNDTANKEVLEERTEDDMAIEEFLDSTFDVYDDKAYEDIIGTIKQDKAINEEIDTENIKIDLKVIKQIVILAYEEFPKEMRSYFPNSTFLNLAVKLFVHVFFYANIYNIEIMGEQEILYSFIPLHFFDYNFKLKFLDAITKRLNLDSSMHPYRIKQAAKKAAKIIPFEQKSNN